MNIIDALNIGSLFQNVAFYTFLSVLLYVIVDNIKYSGKQKLTNIGRGL